MHDPRLTSSDAAGFGRAAAPGWLARLAGGLLRMLLAVAALLFTVGLLFALTLIVLVSLLAAWLTGRRASPAAQWAHWRDSARRRWPGAAKRSATPRADANQATGSGAGHVQDVAWRELPLSQPASGGPAAPESAKRADALH